MYEDVGGARVVFLEVRVPDEDVAGDAHRAVHAVYPRYCAGEGRACGEEDMVGFCEGLWQEGWVVG